ncbi:flagellin [Marinobacter sp. B9-2]|nr:flagellin [Marinobacter sp. B9-2]
MALGINTNVASLSAQNQLNSSQKMNSQALERLSSGLRINSAKDDAAGLAISSRFDSQVRGLDVAQRNANDGVSLAQTAEGALESISDSLQRIRELGVQSRNATNSDSDRSALNDEAQALKAEINRIASQTQFNGINLLDGSFTDKQFQVGANQGQTISISGIVNANAASLGEYSSAKVSGAAASTFTAIDAGDVTIKDAAGTEVSIGAIGAASSAQERAEQLRVAINAVSDETGVTATFDTDSSLTLSTTTNTQGVSITTANTATLATTGFAAGTTTQALATNTGFNTLDISTTGGADTAITQMDAALSAVNTARSKLGAVQNRFESTISNIASTSENLSAANSRILDADFAAETAKLSKSQVLQQAGISVLAQANARPQQVLSLLQ